MDHTRCNVVYLDRRAQKNALWKRDDVKLLGKNQGSDESTEHEEEVVQHNVRAILATFEEGMRTPSSLPQGPS